MATFDQGTGNNQAGCAVCGLESNFHRAVTGTGIKKMVMAFYNVTYVVRDACGFFAISHR